MNNIIKMTSKDITLQLRNVQKLKRASFDTPSHIQHILNIAANHTFEQHHISCK